MLPQRTKATWKEHRLKYAMLTLRTHTLLRMFLNLFLVHVELLRSGPARARLARERPRAKPEENLTVY